MLGCIAVVPLPQRVDMKAAHGLCPQGSSVPTGDLPPTTVLPTTTITTTTTTPRPPPRNVGTRCDLCAKAALKGEQILNELCKEM